MPKDMMNLPVIGRAASVRPETVNLEARTVEVVWTTGAVVQRARWEGWDDRIEYDEELLVTPEAMRLERLNAGGPFLDSHRSWGLESVLGAVVPGSVRVADGKGYATIQLTGAADAADRVARILDGTVRNVSVGYLVHSYEITRKQGEREHWRAVDWEPMEISAVAIPADPGAQTRAAGATPEPLFPCAVIRRVAEIAAPAAAKEALMPNPNPAADDQNAARNNAEQLQERAAPGGQAPGAPEATPPAAGQEAEAIAQRAVAVERERVSTIGDLCRRHGLEGEFMSGLIARGVSVAAAREQILDHIAERDPLQGRAHEPARPRDDGSASAGYRAAVENALQHRAQPGVALTDAGRDFRGMTLMEIARQALERSGVSTRGMSKMEVAAAALGQRSVGYHTSGDFPTVLANLGNRTLRDAYDATPRTFIAWARRASLSDFRPTTRVQISNAPKLEKVLEGAEFQYGTFGEASTQYALATYGKVISFSRQMLINDDLGAFTRVAASFGARASQLEADLVYAILLNNGVMSDGTALFHANHGNLGTAAAIDEGSLTAAYTAYAKQTDIDGTAIDVSPEFILVPPGQRALEARKLLTATTPSTTSQVNTYAGRLSVVEERRLLPPTGAAPWFLAASNSMLDTVEYAYLDGNEGVFTETRNGFEVDGVEVKARLDFAASAIDHRGLYKNAGV
ncbi:prohead protease/major capsid protein fusion protein [Paracoccus litorisediminis]|uniref:Peptidase U35 n=1 Tax=Paracoccus litorisediminis TaxID=2006130 RepID=A0A844HUG4_9RHOB|nr:prohead protease/major capsid protein fusion protein [Paracoccus litorisediminis]MTH62104.1 peptidase U35 [Paracoccus litorisediminis]